MKHISTADLIAAATAEGVSSTDIERLIAIGQDEVSSFANRAKAAKNSMLDPETDDETVARQKAELDAIDVASARMGAALARLQHRLEEVRREEANADRLSAYEAAEATGITIAKQIREVYPAAAAAIAELLRAINEHERMVDKANGALPEGKPALVLPEVTARNMTGIEIGYASLRNSVRLAALDAAEEREGRSIWKTIAPGCSW